MKPAFQTSPMDNYAAGYVICRNSIVSMGTQLMENKLTRRAKKIQKKSV